LPYQPRDLVTVPVEKANAMPADRADATIYQRPAELLRRLIRFDTTNPPGNEAACVLFVRDLLDASSIASTIVARDPARPNLIARLPGRGHSQGLLLQGHVDVVTTADQDWTHPPFAGDLTDGFIWGRGALDMKGGVAMMLAAFLRANAEGADLPGDVLLCIVSDEEAGGNDGARFLVEQHADLFTGVRFALGELGGFTATIAGTRFYPIMVGEKQSCLVRATVRGPGGHAALTMHGGAAAKLARFLQTLDERRLPVHVTAAARRMLEAVAAALPESVSAVLLHLLDPTQTDRTLDLLGAQGVGFDPLLHNTVNATIIRGGEKNNVIPSAITVELDGRMLPGQTPDDLLRELSALIGPEVELEAVHYDLNPAAEPDMGLFPILADILRAAEPDATPIPLLFPAVTDARFFSRLGIQSYGFLPMQLPEGWNFTEIIHAADERIPVEAVAFGADAIYQALLRFGEAK
jgi:acetylornithine deacetylase/succinyl-diaminopimelate desuccinylase-like protein